MMPTIEPIAHADYMAELQHESYGEIDLGEGVVVTLTESMVDSWFSDLTPTEKVALYLRDTSRRDIAEILPTLMLRKGLNSFLAVIEEECPVVSSPNAEAPAVINREVASTVGTTFHSVAQADGFVVEDLLPAQRAVIARSLHRGLYGPALGVGELRHTEMVPAAAVETLQ